MARRSFQQLRVNGQDVQLRVFLPGTAGDKKPPAVVMVCGLLWLGGGLLGEIGLRFNDVFGYAFARVGLPCVQIHTPQQHIAQTRMLDLALLCLLPMTFVPVLRYVLLAVDLAFLVTSRTDLLMMLPLVVLPASLDALWATTTPVQALMGPIGFLLAFGGVFSGAVFIPMLHITFRAFQWMLGELDLDGSKRRNYLDEVDAAVAWADEHCDLLGSNGRLVLCGYSSGAHVAALYGLRADGEPAGGSSKKRSRLEGGSAANSSGAESIGNNRERSDRRFEAVVLISGIYDLRTCSWSGLKRCIAPAHNLLYGDIIAASSDELREAASPVAVAQSKQLSDCPWWVLSAKKELMGLQPFEHVLFDCKALAAVLAAKGATVKRAECGYNHWLLIFSFAPFAKAFAESLQSA
eukprot:TRINITY_DN75719_c0_g1_i1.p1 TRINITY_DN75719_c0_g1~~TRINITY_DN75719_c0_g1_i1.p1  ORF type:complete len:407 (-),score=84.74 TRINITY_DN75719_c0_g1_i1:71-1291(-)